MDESLKKYWQQRDKQLENDKKNYKGPHCCLIMDYCIDESDDEKLSPIVYNPKFREYYLQATGGPGGEQMHFCTECGSKLPEGLSSLWFDILEDEYGLKAWKLDDKKKISAEFLTDEWWKRRGL